MSTTSELSSWIDQMLLVGVGALQRAGRALTLPSEEGLEGTRFHRRQAIVATISLIVLCGVSPYLVRRGIDAAGGDNPEIGPVKLPGPRPPAVALQAPRSSPELHPLAAPTTHSITKTVSTRDEVALRDVESHWRRGEYSEAMTFVDQILDKNPQHSQAMVWKKRISAAQRAEVALK